MSREHRDPYGVKQRLARLGLEQKQAAQGLNWSPSKMSRAVSGVSPITPADREVLDDWLRRREIEAFGEARAPGAPDYEHEGEARRVIPFAPRGADAPTLRVPVYGLASAGTGVHLVHDSVVDHIPADDLLGGRGLMQARFLVEVTGSCMEPRYRPGERVMCIRNRHPRPFEDAVFEMKDGSAQLKFFVRRHSGIIVYGQYNEEALSPAERERAQHWREADVKAIHAVIARF